MIASTTRSGWLSYRVPPRKPRVAHGAGLSKTPNLLTYFFIEQRFERVSKIEAVMAKQKKTTGKTKAKRKKIRAKASARKKTTTVRKTRPSTKKTVRKTSLRGVSPRKAKPIPAKPTPVRPAPTPVPAEQRIGVVTHFYSHL